jgi:enterochelin esterase family protein
VLYLLHGSGDRPTAWTESGNANFIFDNLLAQKQAKPMIVVMPFGHAVDPFNNAPEMRGRNTELFTKDLLGDVMPQVAEAYQIATGPANTAIAGLSMGGGQALFAGLTNPNKFAYVAGFSASVPRSNPEEQFASTVADPAATNKAFKLIWMATGKDDGLLQPDQRFVDWMKAKGVNVAWKETEGAHTWRVWRRYLAEFAPLLFR